LLASALCCVAPSASSASSAAWALRRNRATCKQSLRVAYLTARPLSRSDIG
jgi:hypothetical protein